MIKEWIERRKEQKAMKQLDKSIAADKELRERCLDRCKYMDADSPEELIRFAEALRLYVEGRE